MKKILAGIVLTFAFISSKAQTEPITIVDSVEVAYNTLQLINPNDIKNLNIVKNEGRPDGILYITLKDHNILLNLPKAKILSLQDLNNTYISEADKGKPVLYILNGELLTDTTNVKVHTAHWYNVSVIKANQTPYFKDALPNALIMKIKTYVMIKPGKLSIEAKKEILIQ